jgi:hypothetical protein
MAGSLKEMNGNAEKTEMLHQFDSEVDIANEASSLRRSGGRRLGVEKKSVQLRRWRSVGPKTEGE